MAADSPVWLLQFSWCGAVYRFATRDVTVTDSTGRTLTFLAGLQDLTLGRAVKDVTKSTAKLRVSTWLDWAAIAKSALLPLDGHYAELRRARPDAHGNLPPWDQIPLWAAGPIRRAQWGERGAPLDLDVPRGAWGDTEPIIPASAVITDETHPEWAHPTLQNRMRVPDASQGRRYPLVFGRARQVPVHCSRMEYRTAISATNRVIVSYGEIDADQVTFRCPSRMTSRTKTVHVDQDALGQTYSYVEVTDGGIEILRAAADPMFADFDRGRGGAIIPSSRREARTAADVILYLMAHLPRAVWDESRMAAERQLLDQVVIDTYIDDDVEALDWLQRELLAHIPGTWAHSGRGLYYQPMDYTAARTLARWEIRTAHDGGSATRLEDPQLETAEVRNELVLHFGRQTRTQDGVVMRNIQTGEEVELSPLTEWRATARLSPRAGVVMSGSDMTQPWHSCRVSREHWGDHPWEGTTYAIETWESAWAILRMMAARHALPKRRVSYEGPSEWESMQVGDVVIVYDSEIGVEGRVGLVEDVWVGATRPNADLVLLDEVA